MFPLGHTQAKENSFSALGWSGVEATPLGRGPDLAVPESGSMG